MRGSFWEGFENGAFSGEDISFGQVLFNMTVSGLMGAAFAGLGYGLSRGYQALKLRLNGPQSSTGGVVEFTTPKDNVTLETISQTESYVRGCNEDLKDGALPPTGRVTTQGQLGRDASNAAGAERAIAAASSTPYQGVVGHVPDTTWTGNPKPYSWLDLNSSVNSSLGRQLLNYPIGYQPTRFVLYNPHKKRCESNPLENTSEYNL